MSRRFKDSVTGEWKDSNPTFVPIIVWGDQAERCADKLKKGMPVHVEGRLQTSSWQATDGTKKSKLEVVASRVQFLVRLEQQQTSQVSKTVDNEGENEYVSDNDVNINDEEVPF